MEEARYGKVIKSSIFCTLTALLAIFLIVFSVWSFINPKSMGDSCYKIGLNKLSIRYQYKEYQKSDDDINALGVLTHRAISFGNNWQKLEYTGIMIKHPNFIAYCLEYDNLYSNQNLSPEYDYITGHYISALYDIVADSEAFDIAKKLYDNEGNYSKNSYSAVNPIARFISRYAENENRQEVDGVFLYLGDLYIKLENNNCDKNSLKNISADGYSLAIKLGDSSATLWKERFNS